MNSIQLKQPKRKEEEELVFCVLMSSSSAVGESCANPSNRHEAAEAIKCVARLEVSALDKFFSSLSLKIVSRRRRRRRWTGEGETHGAAAAAAVVLTLIDDTFFPTHTQGIVTWEKEEEEVTSLPRLLLLSLAMANDERWTRPPSSGRGGVLGGDSTPTMGVTYHNKSNSSSSSRPFSSPPI